MIDIVDLLKSKGYVVVEGEKDTRELINLVARMEEIAQLPRDGSNPVRKPGERGKYEESHYPSGPPTKTHQ